MWPLPEFASIRPLAMACQSNDNTTSKNAGIQTWKASRDHKRSKRVCACLARWDWIVLLSRICARLLKMLKVDTPYPELLKFFTLFSQLLLPEIVGCTLCCVYAVEEVAPTAASSHRLKQRRIPRAGFQVERC